MRKLEAGVAGGILAGALVGATEALVVWHRGAGPVAVPPIGWAVLVYGALGGLGGGVAALLAAVAGTDAFGLALGGVGAGLALVVGRARIVHDVLHDAPAAHGVAPVVLNAAAGVAAAALAIVLWRLCRGADAGRGALTRVGVVSALVALVGAGGMLAARAGTSEAAAHVPAAPGSVATASATAPDVVLIVVDSLRADHLSSYGYARGTSPRIDALAAEGTRWSHAFAAASSTRASMASLLTGLVPTAHGAVRPGDRLPDAVETLAEVLARGGYYAAAFANDADVFAAWGFAQGFAEYHDLAPAVGFGADPAAAELVVYDALRSARERLIPGGIDKSVHCRPAPDVVDRVRTWLDGAGAQHRPFFLVVHLMDPHEPYVVHPANGTGYGRRSMPEPTPAMVDVITDAYDGEIAYADEHVGRLLDELRARGLYDGTLVVLTSDHGEELVDHGGWWHGSTLYEEQLAVPLVVKPPHGGTGRVGDALVSTVDVAPTILAAAGLTPSPAMRGVVLPLGSGAVPPRDVVFAEQTTPEGAVLRAVRSRAWKLLTASPGNARGLAPVELYAIADDPTETRNLAAVHPTEREQMRAALGRAVLAAREHVAPAAAANVDTATKDRLKALGYVD